METNFRNIFHEWHNYLVDWTRDRAPKLNVILVLAIVSIRLLGLVTRKLAAFSERTGSQGALRAHQIRTVVGMIRSVGVFLILFIAAMLTLKEVFNFNIAPLLASAGIAGLAVGFGAQALVKDVINGFFILAEDQFQVGDTIRAAGVTGKVEEIAIRRTTLRDADGTVHIVPNGSFQVISNMNRDWTQVALQISVDYTEDSDRVLQVLGAAVQGFYQDAAFKPDIVAEPQVPGIERVRGREVDYLVLIKVRPGKQDGVARELRQRIKTGLEQNQIQPGVPAQIQIVSPESASSVAPSVS